MNKEYLIKNLNHWDWESYGKENPELCYNFSSNAPSSLLNHALKVGIKEGRTLKFDKNKNFLKHIDRVLVTYLNQLDNFLIIHPVHGLSNRLKAIGSAYSICKALNRNLIINWKPDCHCDCKIEDIIVNIDDFCVAVIDSIDIYRLMKLGVTIQRNYNDNPVIDHSRKKIYVESNTILNNNLSNKYITNFCDLCKTNVDIAKIMITPNNIKCIQRERVESARSECRQRVRAAPNNDSLDLDLLNKKDSSARSECRQRVHLVTYLNQLDNFLIIQPVHGLSNRLRAIASAYSICKALNRNLIINWKPDCHCDCKIEDIIVNIDDFCVAVIDSIDTNKLMKLGATFQNYEDNPIIDHSKNKLYIVSQTILANKYSNKHLISFLKSLVFNNKINNLIDSIPNINEHIGMHIRMGGGKEYQTIDADKESNWFKSKTETEMLYKYRKTSHIDNFINQINNILHKNPEQKFYIATDMNENYEKLIQIYGDDTIKFLHRDLFDRSKEQIDYAIADIILLSKCKQFYGSTWSSFSELVTYYQPPDVKKLNVFSNNFKIQNLSYDKNFFNIELKNGNSIVCVSMNRTDNLLKALPFWLRVKDCDEIVILDFGSTIPLTESLKQYTITNEKLKIYRVDNVTKWHLSKAYNLVIKLASYKNIYKLDSDDCCNENVIINHPLNYENVYYHGRWQHARNKNERQIAGKMFFTYDLFVKTNGYNENITTYGWEDCEFDLRLNEIGIRKDINIDDFVFIEHGNDLRITNGDLGLQPIQYILMNSYLCKRNIINWNKRSLHTDFIYDKKDVFHVSNKYHIENEFINKKLLTEIISKVNKCL